MQTFILASFCIFAGRHDRIPQSLRSSSSTSSSFWCVFSRSMRLDDGCRLWHLIITVSGATDEVIEVVVTAGLVSVVETVTLCVCTGLKLVITVVVLGNDSVSVSWGRSALLSSCVSEYSPVISYCDSCRLERVKLSSRERYPEHGCCNNTHRWPFLWLFWESVPLAIPSVSLDGCTVELIMRYCCSS